MEQSTNQIFIHAIKIDVEHSLSEKKQFDLTLAFSYHIFYMFFILIEPFFFFIMAHSNIYNVNVNINNKRCDGRRNCFNIVVEAVVVHVLLLLIQ